ncbi:migration and invasion-inhibitory protein [Polypterus senegalus]|uniref:migration and invasion-inhibitory protein n=1 Tax=Polypterus senegalus TaxID=55291 RepID=UPI001963A3CC|nr:migration and invasion-inhibitory protein [Polypterus senegalus]
MEYHENLCEKAFLGYDWIAGQLDAESSLSDQSEEYFTELRNFRQVNKDECFFSSIVREEDVEFTAPPLVEPQLDLLPSLDTHQCTHCYRVDRRLFTVPLEPEAACAICKLPRNHLQSSEQKPAFIRISIPRSTLLPAYKYKAHRRKSFDPTDSLSLPSHCLSGWSNNGSLSTSHSNSFGIRKSCSVSGVLNGKLLSLLHDKNSEEPIISSDELLSLSHAAEYHFQNMEGPTRTVPTSGDSVY